MFISTVKLVYAMMGGWVLLYISMFNLDQPVQSRDSGLTFCLRFFQKSLLGLTFCQTHRLFPVFYLTGGRHFLSNAPTRNYGKLCISYHIKFFKIN